MTETLKIRNEGPVQTIRVYLSALSAFWGRNFVTNEDYFTLRDYR